MLRMKRAWYSGIPWRPRGGFITPPLPPEYAMKYFYNISSSNLLVRFKMPMGAQTETFRNAVRAAHLELSFAHLKVSSAIYPEQHFRVVHVAPRRVQRKVE